MVEFDRKRVDDFYFEVSLLGSRVDSSLPHLFLAQHFLLFDGFDGRLANLEKS